MKNMMTVMTGSSGSQDFFETECINWSGKWPIPFQTAHDEPEDSRGLMSREAVYVLEGLTLSRFQLETWNRVVSRVQERN